MNEAIERMLAQYQCRSSDETVQALREIVQEVALLGLWRANFFDKAAFYGGTALRILHGLDRFSEDLDFTLLEPVPGFQLAHYTAYLEEELAAFGFNIRVEQVAKQGQTAIQSAFLKGDTVRELLVIESTEEIVQTIPKGQKLKIKLEVDTDPPPGFTSETRYLLNPIPFAVRICSLSDLFAGKMHALLFRRWKNRVKGRDWYDLIWYAANHPELHLSHLEERMRQSGHWEYGAALTPEAFREQLHAAIEALDVAQARQDVAPFVKESAHLAIWSQEFFRDVARRIRFV